MIRFEVLENLGVAVAAFSDKADGDCAWSAPQAEARQGVLRRCDAAWQDLVCPIQVHGAEILLVEQGDAGRGALSPETAVGEADGLITAATALPLGVTCADCAPIYLYDPRRNVGGVVHAGREGTLRDAAGAAVRRLETDLHANPRDIHAVIGPSAGPCCYEVSEELADTFTAACLFTRGLLLDLWESNRMLLMTAGVPLENITVAGRCTICDPDFFSYRRDGAAARQLALFML
ncbi:MAG TPA: polyphenol oxidase family protein [Candidatus Hydrogenedentes bacterium]|nr:polyphenol oxidase family protein [Candidatus Hydrogenedentota bacterium]